MCKALQQEGIEVCIVTTDDGRQSHQSRGLTARPYARPDSTTEMQRASGVPTIFFSRQLGQSFKYSRALESWLRQNVEAFDLVHIHAVFNHSSVAAANACHRRHVPYVIRPLGTLDPWSMGQKSARKKLFWQLVGRKMCQRAAALHYTTSEEQLAVEQSLGLNHGVVLPLGVETELVSNANVNLLDPDAPPLNGHPYVLVLSRLHPKKGLEILLEAFLAVVRQPEFSKWRLVLAGDGPKGYLNLLQKRVRSERAVEYVSFPGWLEGKSKLASLRNASLLALPSHQENFGLCALEALACAVPVMVSPQVNLASRIQAAKAGWVAATEFESLRRMLTAVMSDPMERRRRGEAGRQLAREFAWPEIAASMKDLYQRLVGGAESPQT
jgi:glycosyltransferase involved in cell wall biosynthesis